MRRLVAVAESRGGLVLLDGRTKDAKEVLLVSLATQFVEAVAKEILLRVEGQQDI